MKNNLGSISLLVAFSSVFLKCCSVWIFSHPDGKLLRRFEAATIGGFADWFAVSALFHEIQFLPQAYKHYSQKQKN
jgi:uncharacterized membrane-anchored protein YjiN (DUF445 family)